jgi:hypothetical protein
MNSIRIGTKLLVFVIALVMVGGTLTVANLSVASTIERA